MIQNLYREKAKRHGKIASTTANTPFDVDGLYYMVGAKQPPHLTGECALDSHILQETSLSSRHSSCVAISIDNYKYCFSKGAKCQFFKLTHNAIK